MSGESERSAGAGREDHPFSRAKDHPSPFGTLRQGGARHQTTTINSLRIEPPTKFRRVEPASEDVTWRHQLSHSVEPSTNLHTTFPLEPGPRHPLQIDKAWKCKFRLFTTLTLCVTYIEWSLERRSFCFKTRILTTRFGCIYNYIYKHYEEQHPCACGFIPAFEVYTLTFGHT